MNDLIGRFHVSSSDRDILITLKRRTGISYWNTLCRYALCLSLSNKAEPENAALDKDSQIELDWHLLGGEIADTLGVLLLFRARKNGHAESKDDMRDYFLRHLTRGIAYLQNIPNLETLLNSAQRSEQGSQSD